MKNALVLLTLTLANVAHGGELVDPEPPMQDMSGDLPGLLALGAVALVAGVQVARRNRRK